MKSKQLYLEWIEKYNAFGIKDNVIAELEEQSIIPIISLRDEDYKFLGVLPPEPESATIGFLMCREPDTYTVDYNYAKSLAKTGKKLRFLTYKNNISQMNEVDGIMLPGGRFPSPAEFYTDPLKKSDAVPGSRAHAYITSITEAIKDNKPIFGVCAGAQMVAGVLGEKLYRNVKTYTDTDLEHKTEILDAHKVYIYPDSPIYEMFQEKEITVNSRHIEALINNGKMKNLELYAVAPDGIPEAWGSREKNILCIQWHPEDFAVQGNTGAQSLYDWLGNKAQHYHDDKTR